ncbi:MAG: carboxypeptidase-like regulatory domain-containing protein [Candidatus Acidiferrales bacterium]
MTRPIQLAVSLLLVLSIVEAPPPALGGEKKKKPEPHTLVLGTTFTAEGLSLPGIPVAVTRKGDKKPKWRVTSDARGEFAVRLPAGPAVYEVATESKEHENQTQEVEVQGEESVSIVFRLARKGGGRKE